MLWYRRAQLQFDTRIRGYRELQSPTVRMIGHDINKTGPMKRKEIVEDKIRYAEANYKKAKELKQTGDNREMIQASLALYEYVLPVYKNEYQQLARLFDEGAPKEAIETSAQAISDRYYPRFIELYNKVADAGKPYAEKNNINVNWDVRTSPR